MDLQRSLEYSELMIEKVRGKRNILIVAHDNPDPDALAAAYALSHLFLVKTGETAVIACGGVVGRRENRTMVEKLEIDVVPIEEVDVNHFDVVCMVDSQPGTGNSALPDCCRVDIIIDHHPLRTTPCDRQLIDVRDGYGACTTILYEYMLAQEVYLGTRLATAMFYAIRSETQDLGREWSPPDRKAYQQLLSLSNNRILFEIAHAKVPREYFLNVNQALESARIFHDVLVFNLYEVEHPDIVAEMADSLLRMDGVSVVLGMGCCNKEGVLSLRTDREDLFAGQLIRQMVEGLGSAGGHGMIAGGQIRPMSGNHAVQKELENTLVKRLLKALDYEPVRGRRLLGGSPTM
ncbi:MAG: DHH family phosphoesterase [Desulfuromonas sp.]|nr:DHH family phosphoesterase [Desulfuromonas sp.]